MKNSDKYHFSDFTYGEYELLLQKAKENYTFSTYANFKNYSNFILWRHDIDFSVHNALDLAKIESKQDVVATYFIHLHSEFYNFFEQDIFNKIKEIKDLGHEIGLHFDSHFYNIKDEHQLEKYITFEKKLLEEILSTKIEVFSFHNTTPFIMACQKWKYGGLINTYSEYFQENVAYCSDSYGVWRFLRLKDVLNSGKDKCLQVLTHPELWHKEIKSPIERVFNCIEGRGKNVKNNYISFLKKNQRDIIDW